MGPAVPIALSLLKKLGPKAVQFIALSKAAGFGENVALDFLKTKAPSPAHEALINQYQQAQESGRILPHEALALQKAQEQGAPGRLLAKGIGLGTGIAAAMQAGPITESAGKIAKGLGEKLSQPAGVDQSNPLNQALDWVYKQAQQGQPIDLAAARARAEPNLGFKKPILMWEKQTGQNFVNYVTSVYGGGGQGTQKTRPMAQEAPTTTPVSQGQDYSQILGAIQQLYNAL